MGGTTGSQGKISPSKAKSGSGKPKFARSPGNKSLMHMHTKSKSPYQPKFNRIYSTGAKEGIQIYYVKKATKEEAAFLYPITREWTQDATSMEQLGIRMIATRRSNVNTNIAMRQAPDSDFYWKCFVRVLDDPEENTVANRTEQAHKLENHFNEKGADTQLFGWHCRFMVAGDVTVNDELPPIASFLMDEDVMTLIKDIYSMIPLRRIAGDDETVGNFFGNRLAAGRNHIMTAAFQQEALQATVNRNDYEDYPSEEDENNANNDENEEDETE